MKIDYNNSRLYYQCKVFVFICCNILPNNGVFLDFPNLGLNFPYHLLVVRIWSLFVLLTAKFGRTSHSGNSLLYLFVSGFYRKIGKPKERTKTFYKLNSLMLPTVPLFHVFIFCFFPPTLLEERLKLWQRNCLLISMCFGLVSYSCALWTSFTM